MGEQDRAFVLVSFYYAFPYVYCGILTAGPNQVFD